MATTTDHQRGARVRRALRRLPDRHRARERLSTYNQADANELEARRLAEQRLLDKYKGFKPLMLWYSAWSVLLVVGAIGSFGLICLGLAALSALYARYLFRGGLHRVWFFIF